MKLKFLAPAMLALAAMAAAQSNTTPVAILNGQNITQEDLNKSAASELQNLETKRLQSELALARDKAETMQKALDGIVQSKLFELAAAKNKVTVEELLKAEVEAKLETPSAAEVDAFYEAFKERIPIPKAEALPQVRMYIIEQKRTQLQQAFLDKLKTEYGYKSFLEPLRTEIATAGFPSKGPASAPITIVEFSDFECPFCGGLFPTLKQVEKEYGDQVRLVYRQFPLTNIHPYAQKAAEASLCADDQKRFWEFHDSMFGNQRELSIADLKQRAVDMKLDTAAFNQCLDSGKHTAAVQRDLQEGARAGVTGTPALFINGRLLSGNQPFAQIKELIDDELRRKQAAK